MVILVFIGTNSRGLSKEYTYGDQDLESCLDQLNKLVKLGWQMDRVHYFDFDSKSALELPAQAFDGQCMKEPIRQLRNEWQALLVNP